MTVKRHWVVYIMIALYFLVGVIISSTSLVLLSFASWVVLLNIVFWLFFSIFLYIQWLNHELDLYIITNNRIVSVEQISFLNRAVSECNLGQVQEVNSQTKWLFANILHYGTLSIQTAWATATMVMDFAPESMEAARKVLNIVDTYRDNQNK